MSDLEQLPRGPVVPRELCGPVWRALVSDMRRRQLVDGGVALTGEMQRFLAELRRAADGASSEVGSADADRVMVVLSSGQIAERLGCSERWARHLAAGPLGGWKVNGWTWVVDAAVFERWRHGGMDGDLAAGTGGDRDPGGRGTEGAGAA